MVLSAAESRLRRHAPGCFRSAGALAYVMQTLRRKSDRARSSTTSCIAASALTQKTGGCPVAAPVLGQRSRVLVVV